MTPTRQLQEQITGLTFAVDRQGLARRQPCAAAARPIDENGDLMVFDEEKFMASFTARRHPEADNRGTGRAMTLLNQHHPPANFRTSNIFYLARRKYSDKRNAARRAGSRVINGPA